MQELTDDQLDGLFRKSAEEFEPAFDADAWQAMQQQLNERDKTLFWGKLLRWSIPVILLLLLTGGSWYVYRSRLTDSGSKASAAHKAGSRSSVKLPGIASSRVNKSLSNALTPGQTTSIDAESTPATTTVQATRQDLQTGSALEVVKEAKKLHSSAEEVKQSTPELGESPLTQRPFITSVNRSRTTVRAESNRKGAITSSAKPAEVMPLPHSSQSPTESNTSVNDILTGGTPEAVSPVSLPGLATLDSKPAKWPSPDALSQQEVNQPAIEAPAVIPSIPQKGLSVRFLVAPDLSSVGLKDFQRPGTNIGALLEYQFAPRWRVQTGLLRSIKVYESPAARYEWGGTTWPVQPESVYGRCNMLDIPLNLRYDFALQARPDGRQNRWFASAGITTYVMLREDYSYKYANPDDPRINYKAREWSTNTGGYGFSHLNVSAGYERAFGKRLSWQVEPFLKIPLKGVGYYKLNLISTGAFFSLRYKLR
jgi:hypothetical protein